MAKSDGVTKYVNKSRILQQKEKKSKIRGRGKTLRENNEKMHPRQDKA